nr:hypothetical protein [Tanacetum cinerariifolium]
MKQSIAELPILTAPKEKEELIMYLAAAKEAISAVLMTERDGKQVPVYFVSRALQGPKINYTPMEKLILALRFELGEHDIQYRPRMSVKGQILADLIMVRPEDDTPDTPMEDKEELSDPWILFTDGSSCIDGSGASLIITNPEGMEFTHALRFRFNATNNEEEYEALIAGLRIARQIGIQNLQANVDSKLMANQVNEIYIAKESSMIRYLEKVKNLANTFKGFSIKQIPRGDNKKADTLSKITSTSFAHLIKQVLVEELREKAIEEKEILAVVEEEGHTWMTPVHEYLTEGILPEEKKKARTVHRKAGRYAVINEVLYKKFFLGPLEPSRQTMSKEKFMRDARKLIREFKDNQVHRPVPRNLQEKLTPITSPWPFYKWGIDIAEPFPNGPDKVKFLIVAMDYLTKWIEARPVATIIGTQKLRRGNQGMVRGKNKNWVEEVSRVLWAHRTMIKSSNGETPFSLTYGAEAVIPAEIGMPTLRSTEVDMVKNNEALGISLDLLEEKREQAAIQSNEASHAEDEGKLGPKWEGPYEVTKALGKGAYRLRDRNGHTIPQTWNICNLKKCYMHEM